MLQINEAAVRSVVEQVLAQLTSGAAAAPASKRTGAFGVHATIDDAVASASQAFQRYRDCTIDQRKAAINEIRRICREQAEELGDMELRETKIGRLDHKIEKLKVASEKSLGVEFLETKAVSGDKGLTITEFAPFGVIGAITPVTHSLPTLANNAISMLASGNTVVFNAHPSGAGTAREGLRRFNQAIHKAIGIDNLLNLVDPPTLETAQQLFEHRDVRLIVVTGGPAVARAALQSRKRAIVAGPGNPPVVVDETACLTGAAKSIITGGAYDNNLLCIGEKMVFAVHEIFDKLMQAMAGAGAYRLTDQQIRDLEAVVFPKGSDGKVHLNKDYVGKDPVVIAKGISLNIPENVEMLYGETGEHSPFVDHEQMMPFIPFVRVSEVDIAIELAKKYEHGYRHTSIIHSRNIKTISKMARELDSTLFVANGPSTAGLGGGGEGYMSYSIATPTGEGITTPLTFTRQRRGTFAGDLRII